MSKIVEVTNEDMFADYLLPDVLYGVTTNGSIKNNGDAVMGRGTALAAAQLQPNLPKLLGDHLVVIGNRPTYLYGNIFTLPVKHRWNEPADPILIRRSIQYTANLLRYYDWQGIVFIPRPGCGNGGLHWTDLRGMVTDLIAATWEVKEVGIFGYDDPVS